MGPPKAAETPRPEGSLASLAYPPPTPPLQGGESKRTNDPLDNLEPARGRADLVEQARLRPRHPNLPSALLQPLEQGGPAAGVEVGRDFVEEEDRPAAGAFGDEIGMGEDDRQQQRLLLAGRAQARRLPLVEMGDGEVGAVRTGQRASGRGVAGAAAGELERQILAAALERQAGRGRKGPRERRSAAPRARPRSRSRAPARAAPCSAIRASSADSHASSLGPSSASSLLRARIAAS